MEAARVRIGRVRMKSGGADVRVIERRADGNECSALIRRFVDHQLSDRQPPDAVAMVTWRRHSDGGWVTTAAHKSTVNDLPIEMLPDFARAVARAAQYESWAERRILQQFGYFTDDDPAA